MFRAFATFGAIYVRQTYFMENLADLATVVREVESHVGAAGWDQPVRLFAIVETKNLISSDPELAVQLNLANDLPLTSIEQELSPSQDLEELLGTIAWPENVIGAVLSIERIVLPPQAEESLPAEDDADWLTEISANPDRRDVRILSAVMRDGKNLNALRYRDHDEVDAVAIAPDLVPNLNESLLATFAD